VIFIDISLGILKVGGKVFEIFKTKNRSISLLSKMEALNPTPKRRRLLLCPVRMELRAFLIDLIVCELARIRRSL
jgi:hypothetical protein